jgi:hypothetical protein
MSSSDWRRWCDESQNRELQSNLTALDGWSFTAITVYSVAALVAAFFWRRWLRLSNVRKESLWPGFKWFAPPPCPLPRALVFNRQATLTI